MKLPSLLPAVAALSHLIGAALAVSCINTAFSLVPTCAQSCILAGATSVGCASTDFECQCQKTAALFAAVDNCVSLSCPADRYQAVIDGVDLGEWTAISCTKDRVTRHVANSEVYGNSMRVHCTSGSQAPGRNSKCVRHRGQHGHSHRNGSIDNSRRHSNFFGCWHCDDRLGHDLGSGPRQWCDLDGLHKCIQRRHGIGSRCRGKTNPGCERGSLCRPSGHGRRCVAMRRGRL